MTAWFAGKRVVMRGNDLHIELADMDWMALSLYAITCRCFTPGHMRVLNAMWTFPSYPEPRIWNNRVVVLAASARNTRALAEKPAGSFFPWRCDRVLYEGPARRTW